MIDPPYASPNYDCPFCRIARSDFSGPVIGGPETDVLRTPEVTAFVGSHWWPRNEGSVIVIPNAHFESIFDLPAEAAAQIHSVAQRVAVAMTSVYRCEGVSTRQHNGPGGGQEVWHYHLHVCRAGATTASTSAPPSATAPRLTSAPTAPPCYVRSSSPNFPEPLSL